MPRRPIDRPARITGDADTHAAYGVGPATDYALPRGAWVIAPFDMTLTAYRSATGGWSLRGVAGSTTFDAQHLIDDSRRTGWVPEGTPIAQVAGAQDSPGSMWGGEHLHAWITVNGVRMSVEEWVSWMGFKATPYGSIASPTFTGASGGGTTPFEIEESEMASGIILLNGSKLPNSSGQGGQFCLYNPAAVEPAARWQEFDEYSLARAFVDALHGRRKDASEASAVILPGYAWDIWKRRALGN